MYCIIDSPYSALTLMFYLSISVVVSRDRFAEGCAIEKSESTILVSIMFEWLMWTVD